jgi:SepF-like predicted cell division protein (DUF552 family)
MIVADDIVVADTTEVVEDERRSNVVVETSFRDYGKLRSIKINKGCN